MSGERVYLATSNELGEIALPASVVSSSAEEDVTEVEGNLEPAIPTSKRIAGFLYTIKGATVLKPPTAASAGFNEVTVLVVQNASGNHSFATSGITWIGSEPVWNKTATAVNIVTLFTINGGTTWYGEGVQQGEKGATGATGPEAVGGRRQLLLPKEISTFKLTSESGTEARAGLVESLPRSMINTNLLLTSGTPLACVIEVPAKTKITGLGFAVETTEGTPANRTHLWVALLNAKLEPIRRSADYTSSTNTPLLGGVIPHALKFTEAYESGSEPELLYGVICEVMSSTNPVTLQVCNTISIGLSERSPRIAFLGETGRTTPESLASTVVPSAAKSQQAYMVLV